MGRIFFIKPRWRKVFSDLWENKTRSLLVIVSIAIGVFAVGVIAGIYAIISKDMNISYAAANPPNINIITDAFDDDLIKSIQRMDSIQEVEGRRTVDVRVRVGPTEWSKLTLIAVPDYEETSIEILQIEQGALIPGDQQVVLEIHGQESINAQMGSLLEIELTDGTTRTLPVTGIVLDRTIGYGAFLGDAKGYITVDTLKWLHAPENYNQLYVTVSQLRDDKVHLQSVADQITDQVEKSGRMVYRTELAQTNKHPLDSIVVALLAVLLILGVLIVFLSGSLITNTLTALLTQHMGQIGVMKLIGARRTQVIGLYVMLILIYGLLALAIAVPLARWAAFATSKMVADLLSVSLQEHDIIPIAVILQTIIALGVPLVAGIFPTVKGARITVQEAFSTSGTSSTKQRKGNFDRMLENIRGVSRPMLISLRNTFRRKGRLVLTLFTLTLGGAIFISVFNVQASLGSKIDQTAGYFRADVNLDLEEQYRTQEVEQALMDLPGITYVEGWIIKNVEIVDQQGNPKHNLTVFAPPVDSELVDPSLLEGRWLQSGDTYSIAVNESFWELYPALETGNTIRMKVNGQEHDWTIVGIFQFTGMDDLFAYTNYDDFSRILNQPEQAATYRIITSDHSAKYQKALSEQIDIQLRDQGFHVSKVEAGSAFTESILDYINILVVFLFIMAVLTAIVGSIGLTGTLSLNVLERTREIGIMRAIGAYNMVVMKLVITEGLLISGISYILGVIISFPITIVLSNVVSQSIFKSDAVFAFDPLGLIIWLVAVLLLSAIASAIPARNASKLTIREVLSYE